jgi:hypothetical protein
MNASILKESYQLWHEAREKAKRAFSGGINSIWFSIDDPKYKMIGGVHQYGNPIGTKTAREGDGRTVARPFYSLAPEAIKMLVHNTITHLFGKI